VSATFFLVRHGAHALLGKVLVGCKVDVCLDERGVEQAQALAERFAGERLVAVQSSPRKRAVQTARPIADRARLQIGIESAVDEIDCGEWSGRSFDDLRADPVWQQWNSVRSSTRPPGGESMREVQQRVVGHLERAHAHKPEARTLIVSHGDAIRAAVLHYMGLPIDAYADFEIDPGTVTTVVVAESGGKVVALNEAVAP
jgi:broad specificity phosphatase PhoE